MSATDTIEVLSINGKKDSFKEFIPVEGVWAKIASWNAPADHVFLSSGCGGRVLDDFCAEEIWCVRVMLVRGISEDIAVFVKASAAEITAGKAVRVDSLLDRLDLVAMS